MSDKGDSSAVESKELIKNFDLSGGEVVKVLKGLDLAVGKGEFVAIMGPSGSGKSTLVNILSSLESITEGDVYLGAIQLRDLNQKEVLNVRRNHSGIVFQSFALIPYLTARENVKLPLILKRVKDSVADEKALKHLESVGLYGRREHLPEELSGGEQQRVAIARALAHEPKIIYADEPTGNLDTHTGREIIQLFKSLSHDMGITVIMVTHDHEAARETDRIYILQDGRVVEEQSKSLRKRTSKKEEDD